MKRFMKNPHVFGLGACLLMGCLENPGPDAQLGEEKIRLSLDARFQGRNALSLKTWRSSGRTFLRIKNSGLVRIDSPAFLLEAGEPLGEEFMFFPHLPNPEFEYYCAPGSLDPGEAADVDITGPVSGLRLTGLYALARMIRLAESQDLRGHPLGGVYGGTYADMDSMGHRSMGTVRGIIDADGIFSFSLFRSGGGGMMPKETLEGRINPDGSLNASRSFAGFRDDWFRPAPGGFTPGEKDLEAVFRFGPGEKWSDSLALRLTPLPPVEPPRDSLARPGAPP